MSDVNIPNEKDVDLEIEEDIIQTEVPEIDEVINEIDDEMEDEMDDEINNSENIANLMEKMDEIDDKKQIDENIDYIVQPEDNVSSSEVKNKPLPELVSFQDIVEIITSDNNILSNENAFVSNNTKESIRLLVINEKTGKEQEITLKKEGDGSLSQNSYKIIYLRKEGEEENDFDHEEFKSAFTNMTTGDDLEGGDSE